MISWGPSSKDILLKFSQWNSFYCSHLTATLFFLVSLTQFSSVQSLSRVWLFTASWTAASQVSLSFPISQSLLKLKSAKSELQSNHLILFCLLLLLPSVFPSIRVFSKELALQIRWPKYWSFSFKISPSSEYSALISFRIDWFDLLAVQGTLKSLLQHHKSKSLFFLTLVLVIEDNSLNRGHLVKVQFILNKSDKNEIKVRVYLK